MKPIDDNLIPATKSALCWFCGKRSSDILTGRTWPAMFCNDWRFDLREIYTSIECEILSLQEGDNPYDPAVICGSCQDSFKRSVPALSPRYVAAQHEMHEFAMVEIADLEMEMVSHRNLEFPFGCWFDFYSLAGDSHFFPSLSFAELTAAGVNVIPQLLTTREFLNAYLIRNPAIQPATIDLESLAWETTQGITLIDDELTGSDRYLIAGQRAWILDITLASSGR